MLKQFFRITFLLTILTGLTLTSCSLLEEQLNTDSEVIQSFIDETLYEIEERGNFGRHGCYELVFPVTIEFPDETSQEVDTYEVLKEALRTWKENNEGTFDTRPMLAFPIEVVNEEGEIISITDKKELRKLKRACRGGHFSGGHDGHRGKCFSIQYPVAISFPDGTITEAESRRAVKQLIRQWKRNNQGIEERPSLVFPISVELEDETVVEVDSAEELQALKESCRD